MSEDRLESFIQIAWGGGLGLALACAVICAMTRRSGAASYNAGSCPGAENRAEELPNIFHGCLSSAANSKEPQVFVRFDQKMIPEANSCLNVIYLFYVCHTRLSADVRMVVKGAMRRVYALSLVNRRGKRFLRKAGVVGAKYGVDVAC